MKRRDLIKRIDRMAKDSGLDWASKPGKQTGPHEDFFLAGRKIPVPRHAEIGEMLARAIIKQAQAVIDGEDHPR